MDDANGSPYTTFTFQVEDDGRTTGGGANLDLSENTMTINVTRVNDSPVLDPIGNKSVDEQAELTFTATATDQDLPVDTLTFSLDPAAEALGMSITADGDFSWAPTESQGGDSYDATITVTDNGTPNLAHSETISITVNAIVPKVVDLGQVDFRLLPNLSLAGSRFYRFETVHDGTLSWQVDVPAPPKSAQLKLYDADPVATAGLTPLAQSALDTDANQRIDWAVVAGEIYYVEVYGDNPKFDLRIANLVHHEDTAVTVHGTAKRDVFKFDAEVSREITINGIAYDYADTEVGTVTFEGGEERDIVWLYDSAGNESLEAWPDHAMFTNDTGDTEQDYIVRVSGIEDLLAYATRAGTDTAVFHGSQEADKLKSYEDFVRLRAKDSSYTMRAKKFDTVVGDGGSDGKDLAVFNGTDGDETFTYLGAHASATMEGMAREHVALRFGNVVARAGKAGDDVAHFTDIPGSTDDANDVIYFKSHKTQLRGSDVKITARAFDQVYANASEDGFDVARIYDTAADEHLEVDGDTVRLYHYDVGQLELMYEAVAFERAKCYSTEGNDTKDVREHTIDLLLYNWDE